jgi:DNA topoisomerase I
LGNTPAICGKSYVHELVVNAFEEGTLEQFVDMLRGARSSRRSEKVLARVTDQAA